MKVGPTQVSRPSGLRDRRVEWVAIVSVGMVCAALVLIPTMAQRAVSGASDALARAQGEQLMTAARDAWRGREEPDSEALTDFLHQHQESGLLAVVLRDGRRRIFSMGARARIRAKDLAAFSRVGDAVQMTSALPPHEVMGWEWPLEAPDGGPGGLPVIPNGPPRPRETIGPHGSGLPEGALHLLPPPPALLTIAFEPKTAQELADDAARAQWVGVAAAAAFLLLGGLLLLSLRQRDTLQQALAQERHLASLGELAAVMAHEIRNPLASLKGHAQLLAESLAPGRPAHKAERVVKEAVRLEHLTNDLLDFARSADMKRHAMDPAALLRDVVERAAPGTRIEDSGAPRVWSADPMRLSQVLVNVLENAVQAAPEGTHPHARVFRSGECLVFEISDRGGGIPEADLPRIFEPFHTRKTRGTGLGLAVAARIVHQHDGTIEARNRPEGGAVFTIRIPSEPGRRARRLSGAKRGRPT